jgi:hypothetical protein
MKLEEYFVIDGTYELVDGLYNVKGSVRLIKQVEKLPVKFGKVTSYFYCSSNKLKTLEGAPEKVGGDFFCFCNYLKTLEGCPKKIGGYFFCDRNLRNTKEYKQYLILNKLRD